MSITKNSLCKLVILEKIFHGFLIKYDKGNNIPFYCLITNEKKKKEDIKTNEMKLYLEMKIEILN